MPYRVGASPSPPTPLMWRTPYLLPQDGEHDDCPAVAYRGHARYGETGVPPIDRYSGGCTERIVAQLGSALAWGARGRPFESARSDVMECDHTNDRGCDGGRCCYCDGPLVWGGMRWMPCARDHEYWRRRILTLSLLPALQRRIEQLNVP